MHIKHMFTQLPVVHACMHKNEVYLYIAFRFNSLLPYNLPAELEHVHEVFTEHQLLSDSNIPEDVCIEKGYSCRRGWPHLPQNRHIYGSTCQL